MRALDFKSTAEFLHRAEMEKREVVRITADYPDMTIEDAYQVLAELVAIKRQRGHRIIGPKMGLTSQAKMKQMNVEEPIYGYIFDYMAVPEGGTVSMRELIHPKVEAEIAFVMGKDMEGPAVTGTRCLPLRSMWCRRSRLSIAVTKILNLPCRMSLPTMLPLPGWYLEPCFNGLITWSWIWSA